MTKGDLIDLYNGLNSVSKLPGVKFSYAVAKNKNIINDEIEALKEADAMSDEFQEYDKGRVKICTTMCRKDEDNQPVMKNGHFIADDQQAMVDAINKYNKKNKATIDARAKQEADFEALKLEKVEIDLYKVKVEFVPEDINPEQLEAIFSILDED